MTKNMSFELRIGRENVPIKLLLQFFDGRCFDFEYKLADSNGKPILVENQKLCEESISPIKIEPRKIGGQRREFLVFYVEGPDDLLVSVSGWDSALHIDFSHDDQGIVKITNNEGDWYKFQIRLGSKE